MVVEDLEESERKELCYPSEYSINIPKECRKCGSGQGYIHC